jgi:hypothetical protein
MIKLDEVRIMLNRIMGPGGPMTERERTTLLPNEGEGDFAINAQGAP